MLKLIIILIFLLTISLSSSEAKQEKAKIYDLENKIDQEWSAFKSRHRKKFRSILKETQRKKNFEKTLSKINEQNKKYNNGEISYKSDINMFSDWDDKEFMEYVKKGFQQPEMTTNDNIQKATDRNKRDALPQSIDWRANGVVRSIQDQGECGSCWAFSTIDVLESYYAIANNGTFVDLSEQQLVDCVYARDGCDGGIMTTAWNYLIYNNGINTESSYPYTSNSTGIWNGQCRYNVASRSNVFVDSYVSVTTNNEISLQTALATKGPVSVALYVTNNFKSYASGVFIDNTCPYGNINHAVTLVGYDKDASGNEYYILRNQWGTSWGMNGYMYFARNKNNMCGIASYATYPILSKTPTNRTTTYRSTTSVSITTQMPSNLIVNLNNFLVFGPGAGDSILSKADDTIFGPYALTQNTPYLDSTYSSFFICINGYIKFSSSLGKQIYPYYVDLDTRYTGNILYRRLNATHLNNVKSDINAVNSTFTPTSGLVVTWYQVPRYNVLGLTNGYYTFQAVVVSNGIQTYLMYNYDSSPSLPIYWSSTTVGIDTGSDYNVFNANSSINMATGSNVNVNGKWIFKVDTTNGLASSTLPPTTVTPVPSNLIVNLNNFLVFGPGVGDSILSKADDSTFGPLSISQAIPYLGSSYSNYYININGYIKFSTSFSRQIYPYNTDLDTRYTGNIFYRRLNATHLNNVKTDINAINSTFTPTSGLVVTWYRVPKYGSQSNIYTFQAVLVSNGIDTYLMYNYDNQSITWSLTETGFDSGNDYNLFSGNSSIVLPNASNVNVKGKWIFKVDSTSYYSLTTTSSTPLVNANFLAFGLNAADTVLPKGDDICAGPVWLSQNIQYLDSIWSDFYACVNGKIGLGISNLPVDYPIYPYKIDLITTSSGNIYYRRLSSTDLNNVKSEVNNLVDSTFTPTHGGFVVTWYRVPRYGSSSYIYTFQAVLVSNVIETYLMYNYDNQTSPIIWSSTYIGYESNDAINLFNPNSSINMATASNVNVNGKWIFKVDSRFIWPTTTTTTATQKLTYTQYRLNIRLIHAFNDSLNDPTSTYYIQMKNTFTRFIQESFVNTFQFLTINKFKNGSIIVDSSLTLVNNGSSSLSSSDIQTTLINSALTSNSLTIDSSSIAVQSVAINYPQNGSFKMHSLCLQFILANLLLIILY